MKKEQLKYSYKISPHSVQDIFWLVVCVYQGDKALIANKINCRSSGPSQKDYDRAIEWGKQQIALLEKNIKS